MVNQELNFHTQDNNLVIRGGCDLFTTKPIGSDRKLFKTIDKHLNQIMEDNQLSQSIERERQNSLHLLFGSSASPPGAKRDSYVAISDRERRASSNSQLSFRRGSLGITEGSFERLNLLKSLGAGNGSNSIDGAGAGAGAGAEESPFGPLRNSTTRKTFAYLIAILNSTYPDHDFLNLQPTTENFHRIDSPEELIYRFNNLMVSLGKREDLLNWIWDTINVYMDLIPSRSPNLAAQGGQNSRNGSFSKGSSGLVPTLLLDQGLPPNVAIFNGDACQIYEFQPSDQSILQDLNYPYQSMWSYYWFIYNKKKKRVSFLYLTAVNKIHYSMVNRAGGSTGNKGPNKSGHNDKDDEDDEDDDMYMDEYMDSEVLVDDDDDNDFEEDTDVVGDLEI